MTMVYKVGEEVTREITKEFRDMVVIFVVGVCNYLLVHHLATLGPSR